MMKNLLLYLIPFCFLQVCSAQKIDRSRPPKAGPAPVIKIGSPVIYHLPNGITVLVVENHKTPKVSLSYTIDGGPVREGDKAGCKNIMGSMLAEGTELRSKTDFDAAIDQMGSSVNFSSDNASVSALTRYFPQSVSLMAEALQKPLMSAESFEKIKSQMLTSIDVTSKSPDAISSRVTRVLLFGKDSPFGEYVTRKSLEHITLSDVEAAYADYITPSRGYLTFIGDITPDQAYKIADQYFGKWSGRKLELPLIAPRPNVAKTEVDLVDLPSAVQSEVGIVNLLSLPLTNPDYFAVVLANQILGGGSEGLLFKVLREKYAFTYGAYSNIGKGRYQSSFKASASVRNEKADSAALIMLQQINQLREGKTTAEELAIAKAIYNGSFALGTEDPGRMADYASSIIINGLPKDFYQNFLKRINAVTLSDINRVAQKYFKTDSARIIIVGDVAQLKSDLALFKGMDIHYFDFYGAPVSASSSSPQSSTVAPQEVLGNYLNAIGGDSVLLSVNAIESGGHLKVSGQSLDFSQKMMLPNKENITVSMNGTAVIKSVFSGKDGYLMQMGNKKALDTAEVNKRNLDEQGLFAQLYYKQPGFKLENAGVVKLDGRDNFELVVTKPSGAVSTEFYDAQTFLLTKIMIKQKSNGQQIVRTTEFSDYKKVQGLLLPFVIAQTTETPAGGQKLEFDVDHYSLNANVTDIDFQ